MSSGSFLEINSLDRKIIQYESLLKQRKIISSIMLIASILGFSACAYISNHAAYEIDSSNFKLAFITIFVSSICFIAIASYNYIVKVNNLRERINVLKLQKSNIDEDIRVENESAYFESLVNINIRNLEEYYELVKTSNKSSFYVSLGMSLLGTILIASGLVTSYLNKEIQNISYIATASGVLIEIISALLFYLYNRTIIQLKGYHDSLLDVQNILLSFKLIEDIKNEEYRSEIMKQMIEFLIKPDFKPKD